MHNCNLALPCSMVHGKLFVNAELQQPERLLVMVQRECER